MSFIHDNVWLLQDLIKIGQGNTLNPNENVSPQQAQNNMALKMLNQIQKDFTPIDPNAPAEISTQSGGEVKVTTLALENIGALVSFLAQNKITVNGKLPVYTNDPGQEGYQMYKLEGNALQIGDPNRDASKNPFWINPELLSAYIVSLQAQNAKKPNRILETYLGALVQESNKLLGTKVNPVYQAPGQKQQPGQPQPGQQGQPGKPSAAQDALLAQIAGALPFNSEFIDSRRIKTFAAMFAKLDNDPQVTTLVQQVNDAASRVDSSLQSPGAPLQMNETTLTPSGFKMLPNQPNGQVQLASMYYTLISVAGRLFQLFVNQWGNAVEAVAGENAGRAIQQQIEAGGPQQTNMEDLLQLINDLKADWQQGRNGH